MYRFTQVKNERVLYWVSSSAQCSAEDWMVCLILRRDVKGSGSWRLVSSAY